MKLRRVWNQAQASQPRVTRLLTLCAFFAAGIVLGQVVQPAVTAGDLADYLRRYAGPRAAPHRRRCLWRPPPICGSLR